MTDELVKHMTGLIAAGLDRIEQLTAERDRLREALKPLVAIADAFDENELDDEARLHWTHGTNDTPHDQIELYQGRGGRRLLTMRHCMVARAALKGETP